ncbi:hypothetical protein AB0D94_22370 [Streptomyces sp. NPDC048255]|uniref:hypothetical protein n=1 Tax=Streptomyces sp. NPDC048255 TaxID=3154713 RepID=UPI0033C3F23D
MPVARLAPLSPNDVISAFNYLHAVEADDAETAADFAAAEPRMPALLVDVAQRVVIPVTNLPDPGEEEVPCDDSFALFELGICFLGTLRTWHEQAGPAAAEGIARAFTAQILTEPHEDVADILEQLMSVALGQALDAHPAPSAHPVGTTAV